MITSQSVALLGGQSSPDSVVLFCDESVFEAKLLQRALSAGLLCPASFVGAISRGVWEPGVGKLFASGLPHFLLSVRQTLPSFKRFSVVEHSCSRSAALEEKTTGKVQPLPSKSYHYQPQWQSEGRDELLLDAAVLVDRGSSTLAFQVQSMSYPPSNVNYTNTTRQKTKPPRRISTACQSSKEGVR